MSRSPAAHGKPSLLAVTSELPWPLSTGGHLRTFHLLRALARCYAVRLVTPLTPDQSPAVNRVQAAGIAVCPAKVGSRLRWREAFRAVRAALRREPYVLYRRHDRSAVHRTLRQEISRAKPQVVYLDHLDSFLYQPLLADIPRVLDLHNVYSTLVARIAEEQQAKWSRLYLRREARLLAAVEQEAAKTAHALLTVSEDDSRHFNGLHPRSLHLIPNGVDCSLYEVLPTGRARSQPIILYLGAMSWEPNVTAALFLAQEVLPAIRAQMPEVRLRIVGRDPTAEVQALNSLPGVEVTGSVPEVLPHLREASLLAVPLEAGGGTRLKILEAFAAGLPVISTGVGCEGLAVRHQDHLLIADRKDFVAAALALLRDPQRGRHLAEQARPFVRKHYDWSRIGDLACQAITSVLSPGSS
ncbi:MAG TPA: glycosyltransferase family 4 protein [Gemmataceae bacterium]|nr:glycosyltransferase family 4 protein [Gemmataceae bacterium]